MATRAFWERPVPLPPAAPKAMLKLQRVLLAYLHACSLKCTGPLQLYTLPADISAKPGLTAMMNGESSIAGWLLLKTPYDKLVIFCHKRTRFALCCSRLPTSCSYATDELPALLSQRLASPVCPCLRVVLIHVLSNRALGPALEDGGAYDEKPTGTIDMNDIALVDTTRTSESGNKDLRLVDKEGQVYLVSAVGEDALAVWHRRFLTAQIIGPGSRTSGLPCPSQPVQYRQGVGPLAKWRTADDEVHSTTLTVKGLSERENAFVTEREQQRERKPATHLWVDIRLCLNFTTNICVAVTTASQHFTYYKSLYLMQFEPNSGPFKTLDGIDEGGQRLFNEVLNVIERMRSLQKVMHTYRYAYLHKQVKLRVYKAADQQLYCSTTLLAVSKIDAQRVALSSCGLYARYAILRMDERALLGPRLTPVNFITFGTPHLGSLTVGAGVMGSLFEGKTASQLQLKDATVLTNGQPFLLRLCNRDAIAALGRFQNRMVYANTRFDNTELYSASIRIDDPYLGMSDKQLAERITPQYTHVLQPIDGSNSVVPVRHQARTAEQFRAALGDACNRQDWEQGAAALLQVGWQRIDLYNPAALSAYNDMVVATVVWLSSGVETIRHLCDSVKV
eukprot:20294-Heterococcus_DN1.PRE.1